MPTAFQAQLDAAAKLYDIFSYAMLRLVRKDCASWANLSHDEQMVWVAVSEAEGVIGCADCAEKKDRLYCPDCAERHMTAEWS